MRGPRADGRVPKRKTAGTARHGITNARLEAMNSTVRLISHRSRGFRRIDNLIGLIHLICGRVQVALPT